MNLDAEKIAERALELGTKGKPELAFRLAINPALRDLYLGAAAYGAMAMLEALGEKKPSPPPE
jgi:hypothetical protein